MENNFNLKKFLTENKLTTASKSLTGNTIDSKLLSTLEAAKKLAHKSVEQDKQDPDNANPYFADIITKHCEDIMLIFLDGDRSALHNSPEYYLDENQIQSRESLTENIDRQTVTIQFEVENEKGKNGYYDLAVDLKDSTMTALSDLTDGYEVKKATKWLTNHISGLEVID